MNNKILLFFALLSFCILDTITFIACILAGVSITDETSMLIGMLYSVIGIWSIFVLKGVSALLIYIIYRMVMTDKNGNPVNDKYKTIFLIFVCNVGLLGMVCNLLSLKESVY